MAVLFNKKTKVAPKIVESLYLSEDWTILLCAPFEGMIWRIEGFKYYLILQLHIWKIEWFKQLCGLYEMI